jgi:hypothetical protein
MVLPNTRAARRRALSLSLLIAALSPLASCQRDVPVGTPPVVALAPPSRLPSPDYRGTPVAPDLRTLVDWDVAADDHDQRPFAVIDKRSAHIYVFDPAGRLIDSAWVLLGQAIGDESEPGIGSKAIADIRPDERTTPAGRFVTLPGINAEGRPVVWLDYDAGLSMHVVITETPSEHRLQRLASEDPKRHRISWGCINLPAAFFADVVHPAFAKPGGAVYVLPETRALGDVFPPLSHG